MSLKFPTALLIITFYLSSCAPSVNNKIITYKDEYKKQTIVELLQQMYFKPIANSNGYTGRSTSINLKFRKKIVEGDSNTPIYLTFTKNINATSEMDSIIFLESNGVINEYIFDHINSTFFIRENHSTSTDVNTSTTTEQTPVTTIGSDNKVNTETKETITTDTNTNTTYNTNRRTMRQVKATIELGEELIQDIIASKKLSVQVYINGYPYKAVYIAPYKLNKLVEFIKHDGAVVK